MIIDAAFHGGNIEALGTSAGYARLRIRPDVATTTVDGPGHHLQWFSFRATGPRGVVQRFRIENAGAVSYPDGWPGYRVAVSDDGQRWARCDTHYADGALTFSHTPAGGVAWYAYFAPYGPERADALLGRAVARGATTEVVGRTVDGRALDLLTFGEVGPRVWILARQHPGETMASWWIEGFLDRLLDPDDALAAALRARARWYVVPNMNPDGSARGHLRVNAAGANLNRAWAEPTADGSPEVLAVRDRMDATGVDLCLDVHGDEGLPYVFIAGASGTPSWDPARAALHETFCAAYQRDCPDFQRVHGYPEDRPGLANLTMCTAQVAERYRCLAMTLEMPFKDNDDRPDPAAGWSPERSARLGAASLGAFAAAIAQLSPR